MKKSLVITLIIIVSLIHIKCGQKEYNRILENGNTGIGIVNKFDETHITHEYHARLRISLTVYSNGHEPFESEMIAKIVRIYMPRKGDSLYVKYDPADHSKIVLIKEEDMTAQIEAELTNISKNR